MVLFLLKTQPVPFIFNSDSIQTKCNYFAELLFFHEVVPKFPIAVH
jgi:hypothetical protein